MSHSATAPVPYTLTRVGVVMSPLPGEPHEVEGVLNPASGRTPDGRLHLLPRLVSEGNVSRVGLAEVTLDDGTGPADATFFEDVQGPFAATVFHFGHFRIADVKASLRAAEVEVR